MVVRTYLLGSHKWLWLYIPLHLDLHNRYQQPLKKKKKKKEELQLLTITKMYSNCNLNHLFDHTSHTVNTCSKQCVSNLCTGQYPHNLRPEVWGQDRIQNMFAPAPPPLQSGHLSGAEEMAGPHIPAAAPPETHTDQFSQYMSLKRL